MSLCCGRQRTSKSDNRFHVAFGVETCFPICDTLFTAVWHFGFHDVALIKSRSPLFTERMCDLSQLLLLMCSLKETDAVWLLVEGFWGGVIRAVALLGISQWTYLSAGKKKALLSRQTCDSSYPASSS